ncbi:MAG: hypothetical protein AB8G22_08945 [Saprospiraceae bacterium]
MHQTFLLEEVDLVSLNIAGDVAVEKWAGNTILTETRVKIFDSSRGIINYFIKAGRYDIVEEEFGSEGILLASKDNIRRPIKTQTGECREEIVVRIFIPEDFDDDGSGRLRRQEEEEQERKIKPPVSVKVEKDSSYLTPTQVDSTFINTSTTNNDSGKGE